MLAVLIGILGPLGFAAQSAHAQTAAPDRAFERPVSSDGEAFLNRAKRRWQKTEVEYLTQDADPALGPPKTESETRQPPRSTRVTTGQQIVAIVVIALVVAVLAYLFWRSQTGGLSSASRREGRFAREDNSLASELLNEDDDVSLSLDELARSTDYKKGLRILLVQALTRAAEENSIPLRRSLTTRDVYRRIPEAWKNRDRLRELIARAEPVLFGGREIDQAGYAQAVETAQPLLGGKAGRLWR